MLFYLVLCSLEPILLTHLWLGKSLCVHSLHYFVSRSTYFFALVCFALSCHVALIVHFLGTRKGLAWGKLMCSFVSIFTTPF